MITYSRFGQQELKRKQRSALPIYSTLYTEDGPAIGTIWVDLMIPKYAFIVKEMRDRGLGKPDYVVGKGEHNGYPLSVFQSKVASGELVLVGIQEIHSITK